MRATTAIMVALCACSGADEAPESQHARTGKLGYEAPKGWKRLDTATHSSSTATWTPVDNASKESVSIVWSAVKPLPASPDEITELLTQSERGLAEATISKPTAITSVRGLSGFQIQSDFTSATRRYHRVHAVLVDGDALVSVFYVAADPDENLTSYRLVLNSLANEES